MIVYVSVDEKYPFYTIRKIDYLLGGKATDYDNNTWELNTEEDVLKMSWLDFVDIPEEKYNEIMEVHKKLEEIGKYLKEQLHKRGNKK